MGSQLSYERWVVRAAPQFAQQHHEERGRVDGAVVGAEGNLPQPREFAETQFVHDFAGGFAAGVIEHVAGGVFPLPYILPLMSREIPKRPYRHFRMVREQHERR